MMIKATYIIQTNQFCDKVALAWLTLYIVQEYQHWIRINLHVRRQGKAFLSQFLVCIYRLKFDAFSDIDNFVDNLKL